MRPSEKLSKLVRIMRICASICGVDVLDKNYKINAVTYLVIFCIASYLSCVTYTIVLKLSTDFTYVLETVCMVGIAIQGISKIVSILRYQSTYRSQYELLFSIYEQYEAKGKNYSLVLNKRISRIQVAYKICATIYALTFVITILIPFYTWALTGRRILTLQFYIPLLDVDTHFGYFVTEGVHSLSLLFAAAGHFTLDTFTLLYFANSALFADIFHVKANELNELATDIGSQQIGEQLKDIIEWHQTYSHFVENSDMIFFWINFIQVTTSGLSIALTLLIAIIGDWPGAYMYIIFSFLMLYLYCGMGTAVEITNDRFAEEIYAIHWYLLTVSQQKAIHLMLIKSQSPREITVGGFAPLSVSTALQVTKTVYSCFMMMLSFFD